MVSRVFTSCDDSPFHSWEALRWRCSKGQIQRVARAAYVESAKSASALERALAVAAAANGINAGLVAATLLELDVPTVTGPAFVVAPAASGRRAGARRIALDIDRVWAESEGDRPTPPHRPRASTPPPAFTCSWGRETGPVSPNHDPKCTRNAAGGSVRAIRCRRLRRLAGGSGRNAGWRRRTSRGRVRPCGRCAPSATRHASSVRGRRRTAP